ncbi:hypothetical protein Btru_037013 [Bulinus truncatus]|nr:hypothetical protein Btru_037013 [Bulinus truncatus]
MTHYGTLFGCLLAINIFCGLCLNLATACVAGLFVLPMSIQMSLHRLDDLCGPTGHCLGTSRCLAGWFGPACQYQNLATLENVEPIPNDKTNSLLDEKDETCVDSSVGEVLLDWRSSFMYPVTWLRLSFKGQASSDFRLGFDEHQKRTVDKINSRTFTACIGESRFYLNNRTVDIFCRASPIVYAVKLDGAGVKSLCSIYISGGRNVALKQPTWMSTSSAAFSYKSSSVVDGVRHGTSTEDCIRTSPGSSNPMWTVTFSRPVFVNRYMIVNTAQQKWRSTKVTVEVFTSNGVKVDSHTEDKSNMPSKFTVITPETRKMVTSMAVRSQRGPLSLCELEVYGDSMCSPGKYGMDCDKTCHCADTLEGCVVSTGRCPSGCAAGFTGDSCTQECSKGLYGPGCNSKCPLNCQDSECDAKSGQCLSCVAGYVGNTCQEVCDGGRHGLKCTQDCPQHCCNNTCDARTGHCFGCVSGYHGDRCEKACDVGQYGLNCTSTCPKNCNNSQCESTTGQCFACVDGYQGNMCDRECNKGLYGPGCSSSCPMNCQASECDAKSGQCLTCVTGYIGVLCQDVCATGWYGPQCRQPCHRNCINSTCDAQTGHCLGCVSGYHGDMCEQACDEGQYGLNCTLACPENCNYSQCESTTGQCFTCVDGYQGDMCDRVCDPHSFGPKCSMNCSESCGRLHSESPTCHHITGACPAGCIDGHDGLTCEYVMQSNTSSINWTLVIIILVATVSLVFVAAVIVCRFRNRCGKPLETVSTVSIDTPATQNTYCRVIYTAGRRGGPESFPGVGFDNVNYSGNMDQCLMSNEMADEESLLKQPATSFFRTNMAATGSYEEGGEPHEGASLVISKNFEDGAKLCVDLTTGKSEENLYEKIDDGFYNQFNKFYTEENNVYEKCEN